MWLKVQLARSDFCSKSIIIEYSNVSTFFHNIFPYFNLQLFNKSISICQWGLIATKGYRFACDKHVHDVVLVGKHRIGSETILNGL